MAPSSNTKETRIELRVSQEQKSLLERAAHLRGLSLSAYMLSYTLAAAREEIALHERLVLSERDWALFTSILENPPEPSEALKSAVKKFRDKYEQ